VSKKKDMALLRLYRGQDEYIAGIKKSVEQAAHVICALPDGIPMPETFTFYEEAAYLGWANGVSALVGAYVVWTWPGSTPNAVREDVVMPEAVQVHFRAGILPSYHNEHRPGAKSDECDKST
jgi:hypothetical protein